MSSKIPPVFETLPTEVLRNILGQLPSLEDLWSTIRASPIAFGSFRCFRATILIEVLEAHLPAEIFAEFLGLLHIPKYEDFNYVPGKRFKAWREIIRCFFQRHLEYVSAAKSSGVQRYTIPSAADAKHINYIVSMNGTVKRFIQDYQSFVRFMVAEDFPLTGLEPPFRHEQGHSTRNWPQLSASETLRLQRGFLRYELCCRLSGLPVWDAFIPSRGLIYTGSYLEFLSGLLQRWEEEEIRCIRTYVHRQYQVLGREVLAEYRSDVRRLCRKSRHASEDEVIRVPNIFIKEYGDNFEKWTYNMSLLGLPVLQQLLRSEFDDQRSFLKNTLFSWYPEHEEKRFRPHENSLIYRGAPDPLERNSHTETGSNPVYEIFTAAAKSWLFKNENHVEQAAKRLNEIGWVFWEDHQRLDSMSPMSFEAEDTYPELGMCVNRKDYECELSTKYPVNSSAESGYESFRDRLSDISNWSFKEISPAFREICLGMQTSE